VWHSIRVAFRAIGAASARESLVGGGTSLLQIDPSVWAVASRSQRLAALLVFGPIYVTNPECDRAIHAKSARNINGQARS